MAVDAIERILDDATMSPKAYCHKYGCGQGVYDELADYVPDMCIHLVGRTEAVMRHANADEAYRRGFDEGFASADDWFAEHESELREHGWMRLPKDADGLPIHVGDRLMYMGNCIIAAAVTRERVYYWAGTFDMRWTKAVNCRHFVPATVEDVLREMLYKAHIYDEREMELLPDLIAEYATKLRLAGDVE